MGKEMVQQTGSLSDELMRSPYQVVRGTMYSAVFDPEDDDGNRLNGIFITIRVPVTTVVGPGDVVVQFLPRQGERKPEEPCSADSLNQHQALIDTMRDALDLYEAAIKEAEAIMGGEYGEHYGPMFDLVQKARSSLGEARVSDAQGNPTR